MADAAEHLFVSMDKLCQLAWRENRNPNHIVTQETYEHRSSIKSNHACIKFGEKGPLIIGRVKSAVPAVLVPDGVISCFQDVQTTKFSGQG